MKDARPLLVLEDNDEDFETLVRLMRKQGLGNPDFRCLDGQELLQFLYRRGLYADPKTAPRPVLLMLDLNVPGTDGREVLKILQGDPQFKALPVAVVSTSANPKDVADCFRHGANTYVVKTIALEDYYHALSLFFEYWLTVSVLPEPLA